MSRRERESAELEAAVARFARALVRRAEAGDLTALESLDRLSETVRVATVQAGAGALEFGYSAAEVAAPLGITRQAALKRFGRKATA